MIMRCFFMFKGREYFADGQSVADFRAGFWVDVSLNVVPMHYLNRRYWIPPHAIQHIEKVTKHD